MSNQKEFVNQGAILRKKEPEYLLLKLDKTIDLKELYNMLGKYIESLKLGNQLNTEYNKDNIDYTFIRNKWRDIAEILLKADHSWDEMPELYNKYPNDNEKKYETANIEVLEYTSMKGVKDIRKIHEKINQASHPKITKELRDFLFDYVNKNPEISLDQLQFVLIIDHQISLNTNEIHGLLFSHPIAIKTEKRIRELNPKCPSCNSEERHYPLTLEHSIICFICGFEYNILKED